MSIQKKNGKYVPIVYLGKDPATGKEIRKWGSYHDKKKDAEKEHAEMILARDELKKGHVFRDVTFEMLYAQFEELIAKKKYTTYTYESYTYLYDKHIKPIFSRQAIKDIEPLHIQRFVNTKSDLSPASQRKVFYFLKKIFESAVKWQMIRFNPCMGIELDQLERKKDKKTWTTKQIKQFLSFEYIKDSVWNAALWISFSTGMRPGEVCGIQWSALKGNVLSVTNGLDRKKRDTDLKNENSYNRKLYLDKKIILLLKKQKKWQTENRLLRGEKYKVSDYMFTDYDGSVLSPNSYGQFFSRTLKLYNGQFEDDSKKLPITDLYGATRHSFATNAIAMGVEPSVVAYIMGHSTTKTTYDNYVHVRQEPIAATIETLAKAIR